MQFIGLIPDLSQSNIKNQRAGARIFDEYTLLLPAADLERSKDVDQDFNADGLEAFSDINEAKKSGGPVVQFMISPMAP